MKFITEFESTYEGQSSRKYVEKIPYWEERGQANMGNMIAKSFGWEKREVLSETRHTLEIEAFPVDKWEEFKRHLFANLGATGLYEPVFKDLIHKLESYGEK